jgi:ribosomal protein S8
MGMTDSISDMLTRIRNANRMHFKTVDVLISKTNVNIAGVLKKAGYIEGYEIKKDSRQHDVLRIVLKYPDMKHQVITGLNGSANLAAGFTKRARISRRSWTGWVSPLSRPPRGL